MKNPKFEKGTKIWFVDEASQSCVRGTIKEVDLVGYGKELLKLDDAVVSYEYTVSVSSGEFRSIPETSIGKTKKEALSIYENLWKDAGIWRSKNLTKEVLQKAQKKTIR